MAKKTKKAIRKSKEQIIKELKQKPEDTRRNITFSIEEEVISRFKEECQENGLTMNKVVEKLMAEFIK